jgi:hypothetical protein
MHFNPMIMQDSIQPNLKSTGLFYFLFWFSAVQPTSINIYLITIENIFTITVIQNPGFKYSSDGLAVPGSIPHGISFGLWPL